MEVHHHAHTPRKKWTHYLWEFLMLFLAVFCGFLAENFREHQIEHNREKQFVKSLVEDLKSDTLQLATAIDQLQHRELMIDSFVSIMSLPDYRMRGNEIYYYAREMTALAYFFPNDRTILQLKYSGALRLIRNIAVSDSIMLYDQKMRSLLYRFADESTIRGEFRAIAKNRFNGQVFFSMLDKNNPYKINKPANNPQLIQQDSGSINELIMGAQYVKNVTRNLRYTEQLLKENAVQLVSLLKREYHLK